MHLLGSLLAFIILFPAGRALAQAPADETAAAAEPEGDEPSVTVDDPRRSELDQEAPEPNGLWLSIIGALHIDDSSAGGGSHGSAMLVVGGSIDDIAKGSDARRFAALAKSQGDEPERRNEPPSGAQPAAIAPAGRGQLARGCVRAAIKAATLAREIDRLDDAATRARLSGLVPELRVRVARVVDEDESLAPTEYDPDRITASGGSSLWIEGRATFKLDRLVFADDEVALERVRSDRLKIEREIVDDVLKSFAVWQRADASLASPDLDAPTQERMAIDRAVEEARLDVLTDGWFSAAKATNGR